MLEHVQEDSGEETEQDSEGTESEQELEGTESKEESESQKIRIRTRISRRIRKEKGKSKLGVPDTGMYQYRSILEHSSIDRF